MEKQLITASQKGDIQAVRILLNRGADPNSTAMANNTHAHTMSLSMLLNETTPLIEACKNGHIEIVRLLLEKGADPQKITHVTDNPPIIVACKNGYQDIVLLLLERGANPESYDTNGIPLISIACSRGHLDVVRTLVETNMVDIEKRSSTTHNTPLMYAIRSKKENIVKYLLERGASLNSKKNNNSNPLLLAADHKNFNIFKMVFDASKDAGINLKHKNDSGFDVLTIAALHMNADYIEYLFLNNVYNVENYEKEVEETKEIIARYKPDDLEFRNKRYELIDSIANKILLARETTGFLSLKSKGMPVDLVRHTMSFYRSKNRSKKGGRTKKRGSKKRGSKHKK
jgi:ankyrin repeat protein